MFLTNPVRSLASEWSVRSALLGGALLLAALGGSSAVAGSGGGCGGGPGTLSAHFQRQADKRAARADYQNAKAKALHISDPAERALAMNEAQEELLDETVLLWDRYQARLDVVAMVGEAPYDPVIDPADFSITIDNPLMPFLPGTTKVFQAVTDEGLEEITVTVTGDTREILGVECLTVRDVVTLDGEVVEDTLDYYAQDSAGNVWYMGEIAINYEDGEIVDIEGSWWAGVDEARPGILMPAVPVVGDVYRQEFLLGEAEDMGRMLALGETVTVPFGTYTGCLMTLDWTPIEPGVFENKYYAPGVGVVLEVDPDSGETVELVDMYVL